MQQLLSSRITSPKLVALCLRLGLAFVFAYAAIASLMHPNDWIGYMPRTFSGIISTDTLLKIASVFQLLLVGWLLIGKYIRYAAMVCVLMLAGITLANLGLLAITFRDVGLALAALALVFCDEQHR